MGERLPLRDVVGVQMVSSYILIPTAVTTAHGPVGQEIITVRAKQASKRTRFTTVEYWSPRIFKIMFMGGFWAQPTVKPRGTCARRGVEIAFHFLNFTVISFFMACVGKSAKTRSSSSDIQILVNDAIWTLPGQLVFFAASPPFCFEFVPVCPRYLALQTLLSLWGRGAERWQ